MGQAGDAKFNRSTYYAGNSRIFKAVATMAHCAIEGCSSDIGTPFTGVRADTDWQAFGGRAGT
jgi:hypothetical protein